MHEFLVQAAIFLLAAAIAAPLARRAGIGSVLGYLLAGVLIGPYGLGRVFPVYPAESVLRYAELGVVLLLFVIGLELQPSRLRAMRTAVFGAGALQVVATSLVLAAGAIAAGIPWGAALYIGLALSLSSTAFTLQALGERKELATRHGRLAFAILLFQDLAALPILALVPPLAGVAASGLSALAVVKSLAVIGAVLIVGRPLLGLAFRLVARTGLHEAMTATALLTVISVALLMEAAGLSAALGAFIAGVLLADSEYRHEVEADIEPFKGLLLGLFFTAIGMSLNLSVVASSPLLVFGLVAALVALKTIVLLVIGRLWELPMAAARRLGLACSQGGEFAFVLLAAAVSGSLLTSSTSELIAVVVTLSMVVTPVALALDDVVAGRTQRSAPHYDPLPEDASAILIAGFGRMGQIVSRILRARQIHFTALDNSPEQVDFVREFGSKIYYGDAARLDILRAAQIERARVLVLAIDDVEQSLKTAELIRRHYPAVRIIARARNRQHAYRLLDLGIEHVHRETFEASLEVSRDVLRALGMRETDVRSTVERFKDYDERRLKEDYPLRSDMEKLKVRARNSAEELELMFRADAEEARPAAAEARPAASEPAPRPA